VRRSSIVNNGLMAGVALVTVACAEPDLDERRAEVAEVGSIVMAFDLEKTTHVFESTPTGGIQTVVADNEDPEQVALVRGHLAEEADRLSRGDFHNPSMIHGGDMAGLHVLVAGYERMSVTYREVERGGEIRYESEDGDIVEALHMWFEAQLRDHGEHAQAQR